MPWYENRKGERLWYKDEGAGYPVLLVHGWCMSSAVWKYQFDSLAGSLPESFRLLAPDLRGHGFSREITSGLDFVGFAEDLVDLVVFLDLSQVVLIGWSMGAQIALQSYPELSGRLAGIVLVSATPRFTASDDFPHALAVKEASGMRIKVQRNMERALAGFYTRLFAEGELESHAFALEIKQLLAAIPLPETVAVLAALDALVRTDMRHLLVAITTPVLIINGAQDRICLSQASDYLNEHIKDTEQVVFQCSGHAPFLTHPLQFNAAITRFTRRVREQNV